MKLYHFTNTLALVGFHDLDGMTWSDLHDKAFPNSIMKAGLRPYHNDNDPEYYLYRSKACERFVRSSQ